MGGSYGSVQVRSDDREKVLAAAEQVASAMSIRMLVGPALKGWIGIYPEENGQDEKVGEQIAEILAGYVMHVLVHDDSIFACWLHLDGKLIDSFHSSPGYFSEDDRAREEAMAGNPQAFAPIAPKSANALATLFDRMTPRPTYEVESLVNFGKALDIANLVTAYEYLKDDEREGIRGWRQFVEVPRSIATDAAAKRRADKLAIKAERNRLQKAGVLLAREERTFLQVGACAVGDGFLVSWTWPGPSQFNAPWEAPTTPALPKPTAGWTTVVSDSQGRRLALITDKIEIWEWHENNWRHVTNISTETLPLTASILADGNRVWYQTENQWRIVDIESGKVSHEGECSWKAIQPVFHPDGEWLLHAHGELHLVPLASTDMPRMLRLLQVRPPDLRAALERFDAEHGTKLSQRTAMEGIDDRNFGLTRDGQWMWCRARAGLLVFKWESILNATGPDFPPPNRTFKTVESKKDVEPRHISAITADIDPQSLLVADSLGRLYRLNLADFTKNVLFDFPGQPSVYHLILSADQKRVGIGYRMRTDSNRKIGNCVWEVFEYQKLLSEAGANRH